MNSLPDNEGLLVVASAIAQKACDFDLAEQLLIEAIDVSNVIHGEGSASSTSLTLRLIQFYDDTDIKEDESLKLRTTVGRFLEVNKDALLALAENEH